MSDVIVSQLDIEHLAIIRKNVVRFMKRAAELYAIHSGRLLDIAPQVHEGARPFFSSSIIVETFDIDPATHSTYTGDICQRNDFLVDQSFDYVVCTEVLEHTLQPFNAVNEMWRLLKPGGKLFVSTPFNFRIHGPLPDCWRFTEYGLRALLTNFRIIELQGLATSDRDLMPIHYTVVAEK
jgi:SAM-dependent methyltransferase